MKSMGLLQDESEGYEPQRLSKWFASRLDAREVVRNNFRKVTNVRSKTPAEYAFLLSQIFLARAMSPLASLVFAVFLLILAILKGW